MSDDVFASPDTTRSRLVNYPQSKETCNDLYTCSDIIMELGSPDSGPENQGSTSSESGVVKRGARRGVKCGTLAVVGQGLLSVLLLTTLIGLRSYNYYKDISQRENQMLQFAPLLKTNYTEERQLQREINQLQREKDQLQREIERLVRGSCPQGWRSFNTSCYCASSEKKSWAESRQDCRERGADLVIVNNEEEQRFINGLNAGAFVWIGLSDLETEGIWKWVDGTPLTTGYWDEQPNNLGDQDCVEFNSHRLTPLSVWNDKVCSNPLHWICEK